MSTVTTRYVIYASRRRRHDGGGVIEIQPHTTSSLASGDTYQVPPGFPILSSPGPNGHPVYFAFWSVVGGANGPVLAFPGQPSPSVPVGGQDITATAWYVELGGGRGDGIGITIDAFDAMIGDFVFDDFVSCVPGDAAFNTNANWDGFVPTAVAENINAFASIHAVPFVDWHIALTQAPTLTINGSHLMAGAASSGFAFAFYKSEPVHQPDFGRLKDYKEGVWVSVGVMVDGGGPTSGGPVDPWGPLYKQFAAGIAIMKVAESLTGKISHEMMSLAAKQVETAAGAIAAKMKEVSAGKL